MNREERMPEGRGGTKVWRSSQGVHRTICPWTATVHSFLLHLEAVGYQAAPQVMGMDDAGREVLSFIEGEVLADPAWQPGRATPWPGWAQSDDCLVESARLIRRLHEASSSFVVPEHAVWKQHACPALGDDEIVCHGDVGPHNTATAAGYRLLSSTGTIFDRTTRWLSSAMPRGTSCHSEATPTSWTAGSRSGPIWLVGWRSSHASTAWSIELKWLGLYTRPSNGALKLRGSGRSRRLKAQRRCG